MASEDFSVSVSEPTKQGENVSSYTIYKISTETIRKVFNGTSFTVLRRFSDFTWLHDQLEMQVPGAIIPSLPQKVIVGRFSPDFIERRRRSLERFLLKVSRHSELSITSPFIIFLTANEQEFEGAKIQLQPRKDASIKQWFDEALFSLSANVQSIRSESKFDNDEQFEQIAAKTSDLELKLQNAAKHTAFLVRKTKELANALHEFGQAFNLLGQDETDGLGPVLTKTGDTATEMSRLTAQFSEDETNDFEAPLIEFLGMVSAVKSALTKRQQKKNILHSAIKDRESKKQQLLKYRQQGSPKEAQAAQAVDNAETNVVNAQKDFDEISERVLREVESFNLQKFIEVKEMLLNYINLEISYHQQIERSWGTLLADFQSFPTSRRFPYPSGNNQQQGSNPIPFSSSHMNDSNDSSDLIGV